MIKSIFMHISKFYIFRIQVLIHCPSNEYLIDENADKHFHNYENE